MGISIVPHAVCIQVLEIPACCRSSEIVFTKKYIINPTMPPLNKLAYFDVPAPQLCYVIL